jgi:hypothetical protein
MACPAGHDISPGGAGATTERQKAQVAQFLLDCPADTWLLHLVQAGDLTRSR